MTARRRLCDMPRPAQAGILCQDRQFQRFVAARIGLECDRCAPSVAAEFIRRECRVESRGELDRNRLAATRFDRMKTDFDAQRGRIAAARP